MRFFILVLSFWALATPASAIDMKPAAPKEPNVEIWLPPDFRTAEGPWPLIVFSHGLGGCAKQSTFLTSFLAENGYIVAAPDHADARVCKSVRAFEMQRDMLDIVPEKPLRQPELWDDKTEIDRREDIEFTVKSIIDDPQYKGFVDLDKIGVMGHSLGGYTALGLAGGWPSWKDKQFKAVVALSPYASPFVRKGTIKNIDIPVMYQGGTRDAPFTPVARKAYPQTPAPKYLIELNGAGHSSWTQLDTRYEDLINASVLAFFDRYLKGIETEILPNPKVKGIATYWKEEKPVEAKVEPEAVQEE